MPISDYYKIWHGRGSPRSHPHAKSQPPKSPKLLIFGINLSPYAIIFYKIWPGDGVPGPHPCGKFHGYGFKYVGYSLQPQNRP